MRLPVYTHDGHYVGVLAIEVPDYAPFWRWAYFGGGAAGIQYIILRRGMFGGTFEVPLSDSKTAYLGYYTDAWEIDSREDVDWLIHNGLILPNAPYALVDYVWDWERSVIEEEVVSRDAGLRQSV